MTSFTTISSRLFEQNATQAQRAADNGPVIITRRGRRVNVLLSIADYQRIAGGEATIDRLGFPPGMADVEVDFPRATEPPRPADFT